jgi:hypothetical protein
LSAATFIRSGGLDEATGRKHWERAADKNVRAPVRSASPRWEKCGLVDELDGRFLAETVTTRYSTINELSIT